MRVAIIGSKGLPARAGGIERHVEELAARLVKRGFEVTAYVRPWYVETVKKSHGGVRLVALGSIRTKHLDAITHTFVSTLHAMREGFDVYHFHGVGPALLAWLPRVFRWKAKVVVTFHCLDRRVEKWGPIAKRILKIGEWAACRFAHKTIVVSKTLAHYCREVYDRDVAYIPNGVAVPKVRAKDREVLEELGLDRGRYVVMVARLIRSKNAHELLAAWKKLKASATDLRVLGMKLVVVGETQPNDPYAYELAEAASGLKDVVFAGERRGAELHAIVEGAAFGIHPSATEGLPMSVLEKMAHGKAVLTSNIPEHLEIVEGKGFTFRLGYVKDLMLQLYWLIMHPQECARMGKEAKRYVAAYFDWEDIAKETAMVYKSLAPAKRRKAARKDVRPVAAPRRAHA
jgi:glycosyltransferase involved in cell wall biosynthesis